MSGDFLVGLATGFALIVAIGSQNAFVLRQGIRGEHVLAVVVHQSRWAVRWLGPVFETVTAWRVLDAFIAVVMFSLACMLLLG